MDALATRSNEKKEIPTILRRIAEKDKTAVKDCIDVYGDFIWTLARKFTGSREAAAIATEEIFTDIWQYSERESGIRSTEDKLIAMIALRRLIKSSSVQAEKKFMANIDETNEQGLGTSRG
jgi:hypothetical protein